MYTKEAIYYMVNEVLWGHGYLLSVGDFLTLFHKKYTYPSTSTLYKKFGSIRNLLRETDAWVGKEIRAQRRKMNG